jgi:hypothetical protein
MAAGSRAAVNRLRKPLRFEHHALDDQTAVC